MNKLMDWDIEEIHSGLIERDFDVDEEILKRLAIEHTNLSNDSLNVELELSLHSTNGFGDDNGNTIMIYTFWNEPDENEPDGTLYNEVRFYYPVDKYEQEVRDRKIESILLSA